MAKADKKTTAPSGDINIVPPTGRFWRVPELGIIASAAELRAVLARIAPKRRRRSKQDPIRAVIEGAWGPDWPPATLSTREADRMLVEQLDKCEPKIVASLDSRKRAMNRR